MLVLLLSFLNDDDLEAIKGVLESTFYIPGDRAGLELLILKVLPLSSINPQVFLEALCEAYKRDETKEGSYKFALQGKIWEELQLELVQKGYLVPLPMEDESCGSHSTDEFMADDLEAMLLSQSLEQPTLSARGPSQRVGKQMTLLPAWPPGGVDSSTFFNYLQHDSRLRPGSVQASLKGINEIPHLDISSDDAKNSLLALFTNDAKYRVSATDAEEISAMKKGTYALSCVDTEAVSSSVNLEIEDEILNEPFIEATKQLNHIVEEIESCFGGGGQSRRALFLIRGTVPSAVFTPVEEPAEARRFWADIIFPGDKNTRQCCAEAFKVQNRVVYQIDIIREMNSHLRKLKPAVERLEKEITKYAVKKANDEVSRLQQQEVNKLMEMLRKVKGLVEESGRKRDQLQKMSRNHPEDPILRVLYSSFVNRSGKRPEWESYQTQLSKDRKSLIVRSKKFVVDTIRPADGHVRKLTFIGSSLIVSVESLSFAGATTSAVELRPKDTVLWLGHYLMLVESLSLSQGYRVSGYFRVRSQEARQPTLSKKLGIQAFPMELSRIF